MVLMKLSLQGLSTADTISPLENMVMLSESPCCHYPNRTNVFVQSYILKANTFIGRATQATVDAYTGISVSYSSKTITVTSSHTLQEIYDYCQSYATKDAQMPYEAAGLVFTTNNGIPGASDPHPLRQWTVLYSH